MPLSQSDFANDGDSPLLVAIKAQRWDEASKYIESSGASRSVSAEADGDGDSGEHDMVKIPDEYGNLPLHAAIGECVDSHSSVSDREVN